MGYLLSLFFGDEYFVVPMLPISFNGKILRHMRVFYSPSGTDFLPLHEYYWQHRCS